MRPRKIGTFTIAAIVKTEAAHDGFSIRPAADRNEAFRTIREINHAARS
jgi:hypothetical protein